MVSIEIFPALNAWNIVLLGIGLYVVFAVRSWWRLRNFDGPWTAKFSYLWLARSNWNGVLNLSLVDLAKKYGKIVRIGPNELVTSDAEIIRRMNTVRTNYTRSMWYDVMKVDPYVHNTFSETDSAIHDRNRSYMASGYSGKENPRLEAEVDKMIAVLIEIIEERHLSDGGDTKVVDFGVLASYYTLDVLTLIAYGRAFGWMKEDRDLYNWHKETVWLFPVSVTAASIPMAAMVFGWLRVLAGPSPKDKHGIGQVLGLGEQVVNERFASDYKVGQNQDMLDSWMRHGFSDKRRMTAEVLFQIVAGSDTTAGGIRSTMLYVLSNARVLQKFRAEVDAAVRDGKISNPISNAESLQLPYVQAVVKEGLRIHPPGSGLQSKSVPKGGDFLDGKFVPEGTRVGHSNWALQRDVAVYGKDADVFRPERWIEADKEQLKEMDKHLDLVFGYGKWGCVGKPVAMIELNKIFVELFRRFDIEFLNPAKPYTERCYIIFFHKNMKVRITRRSDLDQQGMNGSMVGSQ